MNKTPETPNDHFHNLEIIIPRNLEELAKFDEELGYSELVESWNGFDTSRMFDNDSEITPKNLTKLSRIVEQIDWEKIIENAHNRVQQMYPAHEFKPVNILLWVAGSTTNAKVNRSKKVVGINLTNIFRDLDSPDLESILKYIESLISHEMVHLFLDQLREEGEIPPTSEDPVTNLIWEEGLTTYIETVHMPYHKVFMDDIHFWIRCIKDWRASETDQQKQDVINSIMEHEVFQITFARIRGMVEREAREGESLEGQVLDLMSLSNGFGYHVGYYFWEMEVKNGSSIQELLQTNPQELVDRWFE